MKKRTLIPALFSLLLGFTGLRGQQRIASAEELAALRATPLEALYLHLSGTTLFPGETLYYSVYCMNMQSYRLSNISHVAYVQLVGADGTIHQTGKIALAGGRGQGDLFFNTDLASGAYKLIAFTSWMKNAGTPQFFSADITVVNPYQGDASALLQGVSPASGKHVAADSLAARSILSSTGLALETGQKYYRPGERVNLSLRNYRGNLGHGSYSLSVRRVEEVPESKAAASTGFAADYGQKLRQVPQGVNDTIWVPEQRGALISGRVTDRTNGNPVAGARVAVSLPGENFQLLTAETSAEGRFYAYLNVPYTGNTGFVELLGAPSGEFDILMDDPSHWDGSLGAFRAVRIDSALADAIVRRSIHNQIENSYYPVKPDTVVAPRAEDSYFGFFPVEYKLDDYTRFPTLRETVVEVIENVLVRRDANGAASLRVRVPLQPGQEFATDDPSLVTMDGLLVTDHNSLLDFNANRIRFIRVVQGNLTWGGQRYQGMVAIETLDGEYTDTWQSPAGTRFAFRRSESPRHYYRQPVEGADPHIPDFRHQLLWEADIRLDGNGQGFSFMTSRVPGRYEVRLEGFTGYGKPISLSDSFMVEEGQN